MCNQKRSVPTRKSNIIRKSATVHIIIATGIRLRNRLGLKGRWDLCISDSSITEENFSGSIRNRRIVTVAIEIKIDAVKYGYILSSPEKTKIIYLIITKNKTSIAKE